MNYQPIVLILSGSEELRQQLSHILREENVCRVMGVENGEKCIEKAVELEPDLIVASEDFENSSGMDLFAGLQSHSETAWIPVILVSSSKDSADEVHDTVMQAVDRISFPALNRKKFLEKVKLHLKTKNRWMQLNQAGNKPAESSTEFDDFVDYLAEAEDLDSSSVQILRSGDRSSMFESARRADIGDEKLCRLMADYLDLEYYPVIDPESILTDRFPAPFSKTNLVLAVSGSEDSVTYVLSNPFDLQLMDTIELVSSSDSPAIAIAQPESILALLKKRPAEDRTVEVITSKHDDEHEEEEEDHTADAAGSQLKGILEIDHEPTKDDINRSPIKYIADRIMYTASKENASDIHIEPKADRTIVRYRVHGDMTDKFTLKHKTGRILLSRFKVLADMDIAERRKPQDGSLEAVITGKRYKMRLATTSTQYGESLVIRLLDIDSEPMDLSQLGMTPEQAEVMYDVSQQHTGAIIVVGTTGSGKSTTLYSLISRIDVQNKSLMTIEDPVEYEIKYANQQEVNEKAGVTFEALLRSAVRQDPDIVYLGEIRDPFTAKTVMDLASTGHLTFGTMHSANTTTSIGRLKRLGVNLADILDSVLLIESQRLIKKLCPECRRVRPIKPDEREMIGLFTDDIPEELADPVGCPKCRNIGYTGRQGIYELLRFNPDVISIIKDDESVSVMRRRLHDKGQYLMSDHAIDLLSDFQVAYQDVYRVVFLEEKRLTGSIRTESEADEEAAEGPCASETPAVPVTAPEEEASDADKHMEPFRRDENLNKAEERGVDSSGSRILVVDDDGDLREFVTFILGKNGYNVTSTGDGVDAMVTLSTESFDLIISDVDMPNLNGFKLLEIINNKGIETPVVFLTGRDNQEDEIKGYELGAEDYIRKPIHKKTLIMRIDRILKRG